ncbi:MAG: aminomethyl transferase family protein, partial [Planctomycetes bacterium]|nr:aminomethyl transferase family protein [Planctomycetota bacterium]
HAMLAAKGARFEEADGWLMAADFGSLDREYEAARESAGLIDLSHRTKLELTGRDRASFLHNLCTNDIKALAAGRGYEALITSVQAKVLGHVYVFASPESLVLDTAPGQAERLLGHFDRYRIREDVRWQDRSAEWAEVLLSGAGARQLLESPCAETSTGFAARGPTNVSPLVSPPPQPSPTGGEGVVLGQPQEETASAPSLPQEVLQHRRVALGETEAWVRRVDWTGVPGYLLVCRAAQGSQLAQALFDAGAVPVGRGAFEVLRIEAGTPLYGRDITDDNLPQDVGRNAQAISFTKGCYLGQETVARIDAYGHVNRQLVGLKLDAPEVPPPRAGIFRDGKNVGQITSSSRSPRLGSIALAYVRRGNEAPGTRLEVQWDGRALAAGVSKLPFDQI